MSHPQDSSLEHEAALSRWCPFARSAAPIIDQNACTLGAVTASRLSGGDPDPDCLCLGAACMAWRWSGASTGYCGLAGRPVFPPQE